MAIYKRGDTWWIDFTRANVERIRRSAGTTEKRAAQELHDKLKSESWRQDKLDAKPSRTWGEAVVRWLNEQAHKKSIEDDRKHLRWISQHISSGTPLETITRDTFEKLIAKRLDGEVANATVNRTLAVIRGILNKAYREWDWLDKAPPVRMLKEPKRRVRWLTHEEAERLLNELPDHLADMARFSLATGLRETNVVELEWVSVDLTRKTAWIHADQAKMGKGIAVPLNDSAMQVLQRQLGNHPTPSLHLRRETCHTGK